MNAIEMGISCAAATLSYTIIVCGPQWFADYIQRRADLLERSGRVPRRERFSYPPMYFIGTSLGATGLMTLFMACLCMARYVGVVQITLFGVPPVLIGIFVAYRLRRELGYEVEIGPEDVIARDAKEVTRIPASSIGGVRVSMWDVMITATAEPGRILLKIPILVRAAPCAVAMLRRLSMENGNANTAVARGAVPLKGMDEPSGNSEVRARLTRP